MAHTQKILKLDVSTEQSFIYLKCKQYDSQSRIYQLIITDNNIPIPLKGTEYVIAGMRKPDHTYTDTVCQWKDNQLYLTITDNMLSVAGDGILEIRIYEKNTGEILSTMLIHVNIQHSTLPYDKMISSHEFHVLNNLILSVLHASDISKETETLLEKIKNDIAIYETEEAQRIENETIRQSQEANRENSTSNSLAHIHAAIANTFSAIDRANEIAADLEEKRETGYYKGEDGNNGVILNVDANCYAFEIKGDSLYLIYSNETTPPNFSIDADGYLVVDVI